MHNSQFPWSGRFLDYLPIRARYPFQSQTVHVIPISCDLNLLLMVSAPLLECIFRRFDIYLEVLKIDVEHDWHPTYIDKYSKICWTGGPFLSYIFVPLDLGYFQHKPIAITWYSLFHSWHYVWSFVDDLAAKLIRRKDIKCNLKRIITSLRHLPTCNRFRES